jgi:hypothetical protein
VQAQDGQDRHPVTDLAGTAIRILGSADGNPARAACPAIERSGKTRGPAEPADTTPQEGILMGEQANRSLRIITPDSSWRCARTYTATPDQVRQARAFLRGALKCCPMADDAVLLISELCTNAVQHSDSRRPGGTFTVYAEVYEGEYVKRLPRSQSCTRRAQRRKLCPAKINKRGRHLTCSFAWRS